MFKAFQRLGEIMAENRRQRELEAERSKFKLVGNMKVALHHYFFGRPTGDTLEMVYFYENAKGERKIETTEPELKMHEIVVYFLNGSPLSELQKKADHSPGLPQKFAA
jgi:hypothetical protein